ncbi:MAG: hypothetical protein QNJ45_23885 [Ardenticatenaceae bacterium]|nr:hypothetical protein [Ardenticatenaceae bacterium]
MVKFTLRIDDDQMVKQFDDLARSHGLNRTSMIIQLMEDVVNAGFAPLREGEGFRAITASGAEVALTRHTDHVGAEVDGLLNDAQEAAFARAQQLASPEYGSLWSAARHILEEAGFKVFKL